MESSENKTPTTLKYSELKEQIAKTIFHQTTMERDWEVRKDWVKETFRNDTEEILNVIKESGWVILPKNQNPNSN